MKIIVETKADMSDIHKCMIDFEADVFQKTGQHVNYTINTVGIVTTIELPQVSFTVKKGRLAGMKWKVKKKMLETGLQAACLKNGHTARIVIE